MLHTEDFEIVMPDKVTRNEEVPLILGVGPSFTIALPILLMALFSSRIYGSQGSRFIMASLIMGGTSCIMGVIWGISNRIYKSSSYKKRLKQSAEEFSKYIKSVREELSTYQNENKEYMLNRYFAVDEAIDGKIIPLKNKNDTDYYYLRLGIGEIPFQMNIKVVNSRKEMFKPPEMLKIDSVIEDYKMLKKVPVGIDISKEKSLGIISDTNIKRTYEILLIIILKLSMQYKEEKNKICLIYDGENLNQRWLYERIKFLPNIFAFEDNKRLCASNSTELSFFIRDIYDSLIENKDEFFYVFILNEALIEGEKMKDFLYPTYDDTNIFSVVLSDKENKIINNTGIQLKLPGEGTKRGTLLNLRDYRLACDEFIVDDMENISDKAIDRYVRNTFSDYYSTLMSEEKIPEYVGFLELFSVSSLEEIDVNDMWSNNHPEDNIRVPIGMYEKKRKLYLDINEKAHGPHGLIAGTTGAGKSELIQTFLLSICLSFSPLEINFFIIDYKGGGTSNTIDSLPHCAGAISNLSGNNIKRALDAIASEIEERQLLFSKAEVNHIDAYMKLFRQGAVEKNLPHLILIVDEFAELKKEEPEFMKRIISLSAVGRSLGVHLILATQKPAGVVDDKIWSNSRYRLCLKVQDKQDSNDMLKKPDAAFIKRSGQCILQIGNDEYCKTFQTGYCGGIYEGEENDNEQVRLVTEEGKRLSFGKKRQIENEITVLNVVVDYIKNAACVSGYEKAKSLFIDELSESYETPQDIKDNRLNNNSEKIYLGIFDDPVRRIQKRFSYTINDNGHLFIAGSAGSGKSNLIKLIINSIDQYAFIYIDLSNRIQTDYLRYNNCIGVIEDKDNIGIIFYHLSKMIKHKIESPVFLIIDNFALLYKSLNEDEIDILKQLFSEGIGKNIFIIASGLLQSDLPPKMFLKVKTTLCLEMNDKYQYGDVMRNYHLNVLPKPSVPGRCLYKVDDRILECQVFFENDDNDILKHMEASKHYDKLPYIPKSITVNEFIKIYSEMENTNKAILPIGFSTTTGNIRGVRIDKPGGFIISGEENSGKHSLLENIKMTISSLNNELYNNIILIEDIKSVNVSEISDIDSKFLIILLNDSMDKELLGMPLYRKVLSFDEGIHLGGNPASQRIIKFEGLSYSESTTRLERGFGFMKVNENHKTIRMYIPPIGKEVKEDDYD